MKSIQPYSVPTFAELPAKADDGQIGYVENTTLVYVFNGLMQEWRPSNRVVVFKSQVTVNGKVAGAIKIYTLPVVGSMNFKIIQVVPTLIAINGVGIVPPTVSVGTNSTNYNNIATANPVNSILATLQSGSGAPVPATAVIPLPGGTDIYANVAGVAVTSGEYKIRYDLVGYYDDAN